MSTASKKQFARTRGRNESGDDLHRVDQIGGACAFCRSYRVRNRSRLRNVAALQGATRAATAIFRETSSALSTTRSGLTRRRSRPGARAERSPEDGARSPVEIY